MRATLGKLILASAVLAIAIGAGSQATAAEERQRYIVVFEDSVAAPGRLARSETRQRDGRLGFVYRHALKGFSALLPETEAEALRQDPRVRFVSIDRPVAPLEELIETENNGEVEILEHSIPTGVRRIFAPDNDVLAINGEEDVAVDADIAILDTGIDQSHPDLDVVARTNCTTPVEESEECEDGSGTDGHSHGTHVAGTAAAIDNDIGVTGVAPGARLWAVKVLSNGGSGYDSWVAAGIDWVTAHADEIDVGNLSLGCFCTLPGTATALTGSAEAGIVYSVAAGNNQGKAENYSPAKHPDVMTVSALADYDGKPGGEASPTCANYGLDDRLATFSNRGATIEVIAPGVCILSTLPGEAYGEKTGTSMAAPHFAGAAAILSVKEKPKDLAGVEAIRTEIEEAGNFDWIDTSSDGVQEPLLDVGDSNVFNFVKPPLPLPRFEADEYPATLAGEGTGRFTINLGTFDCSDTSVATDPISHMVPVLVAQPSYSYCWANEEEYPAAVSMNSCGYVLAAANAGPPYGGKVHIVCDEPEDSIEVKTYYFGNPESYSFLVCTTKIGPQEDLNSTLGLANGEGEEEGQILVSGQVSGVNYENSGLCVKEPESQGNGTLGLTMPLEGESEEATTDIAMGGHVITGTFAAGEESEINAARPRLETYPSAPIGGEAPDAFETKLGDVECANAEMTAWGSGASTELQLAASYGYCHVTAENEYPAEWDMNTCDYVFSIDNAGPPHVGRLNISCVEEGDAIEIRIYNEGTPEEHSGLICTLKIGPQKEPVAGIGFSNVFEENELGISEWGLGLDIQVEGLEYERYGACAKPETRTDGALLGTTDVRWTGEE